MTASDQLVRQISAALAHIDEHGTLQGFAGAEEKNRKLIEAASAQNLIAWDDDAQRYQLAPAARKWLAAYYRGAGARLAGAGLPAKR